MTEKEQEAALANFNGDAKQRAVLRYLVNEPATDDSFKAALADADDITVRAAIELVPKKKEDLAKHKAFLARLRQILDDTLAAKDRQDRTLTMEVETLQAEREAEQEMEVQQTEREKALAQYHQAVGQIKTANMFAEFATVSSLIWIQQMQQTKAYKEFGTWENFCKSIGFTRQHIEDQLKNLSAFGEKFTQTVCGLGVGYRDLRKLRQLTNEGVVQFDAEAMIIAGERIPLNSEHSDELQAAIEKIIEEKDAIRARVDKLDKDLAGVVKEETRGLRAERDAAVRENKRLKPFDPAEKDRIWSAEQMKEIRGHCDSFSTAIYKFILDPRLKGDHQLLAEINAHILASENELRDLRDRFETEYDIYGG